MKIYVLLLMIITYHQGISQRSDGFFIQEFSYVDLDLLRNFRVARIDISLKQNGRFAGNVSIKLDSAGRKIGETHVIGDSIYSQINYDATPVTQFSCPTPLPVYVKECSEGRIRKTENGDAYRYLEYNKDNQLIGDRWKPNSNALEIKREFTYSKSGMLDAILNKDILTNGSVDKEEMYVYYYEEGKLKEIRQSLNLTGKYFESGKITQSYYKSGLVKKAEGKLYSEQMTLDIGFTYYNSRGELIQ